MVEEEETSELLEMKLKEEMIIDKNKNKKRKKNKKKKIPISH